MKKQEDEIDDFEVFIDSIGANKDESIKKILLICAKKHKDFIPTIKKFIEEKSIQFNHLWEDSELGDSSYDSYVLLLEKIEKDYD